MITYKDISTVENESIIELYNSVKWTNYTKNSDILLQGIQESLYVLGAFKDNQLIGLVRIVGDGHTIIYIQDILIHPKHQQKGVGQELMKRVLNKYTHVRQKVLLADSNEKLDSFYKKTGFTSSLLQGLTCYTLLYPSKETLLS